MSPYPRGVVEARSRSTALDGAYRIFGVGHLAEPLKTRPFPSRFCDGASGYTVLYLAGSFDTGIMEALIRDRFTHRRRRELPVADILIRACARIGTRPHAALNLLDLKGSGCLEIGAPTDAVRARHFAAGQALGRAIHEEHQEVDGITYSSRLTGEDCLAIFDRAVDKLKVLEVFELKDHPELPKVLEQHRIELIDD
jgi:hypothetical protein